MSSRPVRKKTAASKTLSNDGKAGSVDWYWLSGILLFTFLLFLKTLDASFVLLDDPAYVSDNPYIKTFSIKSIKDIFTTFYNANYHPLTTLSYLIEFKLFGLSPKPYHALNLLLHLLNTVLVFLFIRALSKRREIAIITALFFAIHPMHVESVAWISERKDVLYSFFYLSALYVYFLHTQQQVDSKKLYGFSLLLFLGSLLSKSAAVTFPLLMLVLDVYLKRGLTKKIIVEKIPFFLLAVLFGILTILSQRSAGAINADLMPAYTLLQRFFVVCYTSSYYLVKLCWPFDLSAMHYAPRELPLYFYFSPLLLLALTLFVFKVRIMKREMLYGLLFYLASISLTLQVITVGYAIVSERYSYIPYIGLFFVVGVFYTHVQDGLLSFFVQLKSILRYVFVTLVLFFAMLTFQRSKVWANSHVLFADIAEKYPEVAHAHFSLAKNLVEVQDVEGALRSYSRSLELDSTVAETYFYRGCVFFGQKNYQAALSDFLKAVKRKHDYAEAYFNVGVTYSTLNRHQEAVQAYTESIRLNPNEHMYRARARSYAVIGKYSESLADCNKVLSPVSTDAETYYIRALSLFYLNRKEEACVDWKKASGLGYQQADELVKSYCK